MLLNSWTNLRVIQKVLVKIKQWRYYKPNWIITVFSAEKKEYCLKIKYFKRNKQHNWGFEGSGFWVSNRTETLWVLFAYVLFLCLRRRVLKFFAGCKISKWNWW